jgi:hypothetical protein
MFSRRFGVNVRAVCQGFALLAESFAQIVPVISRVTCAVQVRPAQLLALH